MLEEGKVFRLLAPDFSDWDTIRRSAQPFILWFVCGKPLLAWWLDEAVRAGAEKVIIHATDRPHLVRAWLEDGNLWSRKIRVSSKVPEKGIDGANFPGSKGGRTEVSGPVSLLRHWRDLNRRALAVRDPQAVHLDREVHPGVWVGPGAQIDASVSLEAPAWIGAYTRVGPRCAIGPDAFVDAGVFLDEDVEVRDSMVCADTYVGRHTSLRGVVIEGGRLIDRERGHAVTVGDWFVLSSLRPSGRPGLGERALAFLLWISSTPLAVLFAGHPSRSVEVVDGAGWTFPVHERPRGPLFLRRSQWLRQAAFGRLRLSGPLPRTAEQWARIPADSRAALERTPPGVFALSDLHGCNTPEAPDEWMHAVYETTAAGKRGGRKSLQTVVRIALLNPDKS